MECERALGRAPFLANLPDHIEKLRQDGGFVIGLICHFNFDIWMWGLQMPVGEMFYGKLEEAGGEQADGEPSGDHAERRINSAMFIGDLGRHTASLQNRQDKVVERGIEMTSPQDTDFVRQGVQRHDLARA